MTTLHKYFISIGNSMVSSAILKKTCTSEFFKDDRNCTSPIGRVQFEVFVKLTSSKHTITY